MVRQLIAIGEEIRSFRDINFLVASNGTLTLPFVTSEVLNGSVGYTLSPGASVSLTWNGPIVFANGHLKIILPIGERLGVAVVGTNDAFTSTNVTVS